MSMMNSAYDVASDELTFGILVSEAIRYRFSLEVCERLVRYLYDKAEARYEKVGSGMRRIKDGGRRIVEVCLNDGRWRDCILQATDVPSRLSRSQAAF